MKIKKTVRKYSPILLSTAAIAGTVASPFLAVRAKKKADKAENDKDKARHYILPAVVTAGSVSAIICSTGISWRRTKQLAGSLVKANSIIKNYKDALVLATGGTAVAANDILASTSTSDKPDKPDGRNSELELWYSPDTDYWFWATEKDILWSMYYTNGMFANWGAARFSDFLESAACPAPECFKDMGWYYDDEYIMCNECNVIEIGYNAPKKGENPIVEGAEYREIFFNPPPQFNPEFAYNM